MIRNFILTGVYLSIVLGLSEQTARLAESYQSAIVDLQAARSSCDCWLEWSALYRISNNFAKSLPAPEIETPYREVRLWKL